MLLYVSIFNQSIINTFSENLKVIGINLPNWPNEKVETKDEKDLNDISLLYFQTYKLWTTTIDNLNSDYKRLVNNLVDLNIKEKKISDWELFTLLILEKQYNNLELSEKEGILLKLIESNTFTKSQFIAVTFILAYKGFHFLSIIAIEKIINVLEISPLEKKEIINIYIIKFNFEKSILLATKSSNEWLKLINLNYQFLKLLEINLENKNELKLIFKSIYVLFEKSYKNYLVSKNENLKFKFSYSGFITGPAQLCHLVSAWNAKGLDIKEGIILFWGQKDSPVQRFTQKIAKCLHIKVANFDLNLITMKFWIPNSNPPDEIASFLEKNKNSGLKIYEYFDGWNNYFVRSEVLASNPNNNFFNFFYLSKKPLISTDTINKISKYTPSFLKNKGKANNLYSDEIFYEDIYLKKIYSKIPLEVDISLLENSFLAILCTSPISHRISLYERNFNLEHKKNYEQNIEKEINMWDSILNFLINKNTYDNIIIKLHPRTDHKVRIFFKDFSSNKKNIITLQEGVIESIFDFAGNCDVISPPSTTCFTASKLYGKKVYLLNSDFISKKISNSYKNIDLGNLFPDKDSFLQFNYI